MEETLIPWLPLDGKTGIGCGQGAKSPDEPGDILVRSDGTEVTDRDWAAPGSLGPRVPPGVGVGCGLRIPSPVMSMIGYAMRLGRKPGVGFNGNLSRML